MDKEQIRNELKKIYYHRNGVVIRDALWQLFPVGVLSTYQIKSIRTLLSVRDLVNVQNQSAELIFLALKENMMENKEFYIDRIIIDLTSYEAFVEILAPDAVEKLIAKCRTFRSHFDFRNII